MSDTFKVTRHIFVRVFFVTCGFGTDVLMQII